MEERGSLSVFFPFLLNIRGVAEAALDRDVGSVCLLSICVCWAYATVGAHVFV